MIKGIVIAVYVLIAWIQKFWKPPPPHNKIEGSWIKKPFKEYFKSLPSGFIYDMRWQKNGRDWSRRVSNPEVDIFKCGGTPFFSHQMEIQKTPRLTHVESLKRVPCKISADSAR